MCSDIPGNGKTLLARLFADKLAMRNANNPVIFDTDISGNGIIKYYPDRTKLIDMSRLGDRVLLFDSLLEREYEWREDSAIIDAPDFVVDVEAHALKQFFQVFDDIGFDRAVNRARLDVQIWFIMSWTLASLKSVQNIQALVSDCNLKIVRNMADEGQRRALKPEEENLLQSVEVAMFLNALSPDAARIVNDGSFSFGDFLVEKHHNFGDQIAAEISHFIKLFYDQISWSQDSIRPTSDCE